MAQRPVAIVTGAARGIGRAIALEFAGSHEVALVDLRQAELAEAARAVAEAGADSLALAGDLADDAFVDGIVPAVQQRWGRIDVLVNDAAWREIVPFESLALESWERTIRVCLTAPAFLARAVASAMREGGGGGVIVNVSSIASARGGGTNPAYGAAKGGLDALTYELAALYGGDGIRVVGVRPGAVDTALSTDFPGDELNRRVREWSEDAIPLGRWARAEEIARTVVALAGPSATYVTGTTLIVDGGWSHSHFPASLRRAILDG